MAVKKIEMRPEGTNDYADVIYPMTSIDIIDGLGHYAVANGTNTYTASIPMIKSLYAGVKATVKFTNANSGASTININGLGAKSIVKPGGGNPNIKANGVYGLVYDGTSFQLQGEGGEYGTALASDVLSGKTIGTDNGIITGTIPSRGATTITPSKSAQTIASGQYLSGIQTISGVSVAVANVLAGTVIAGQTGTMPNRGAVTSTITTQGGSYTIPSGYHSGSGKITASFSNLSAGNIKKGVNIGGVVGSLVDGSVLVGSTTLETITLGSLQSEMVTLGIGNNFMVISADDPQGANSRTVAIVVRNAGYKKFSATSFADITSGTSTYVNMKNKVERPALTSTIRIYRG